MIGAETLLPGNILLAPSYSVLRRVSHLTVFRLRLRWQIVIRRAIPSLIIEQRPILLATLTLDNVQVALANVVIPDREQKRGAVEAEGTRE